jgi:hypothetical protein
MILLLALVTLQTFLLALAGVRRAILSEISVFYAWAVAVRIRGGMLSWLCRERQACQ